MPQMPPQKASEITLGTPNGGAGERSQIGIGSPAALAMISSAIWWNTRVATKPAMKPTISRFMDSSRMVAGTRQHAAGQEAAVDRHHGAGDEGTVIAQQH